MNSKIFVILSSFVLLLWLGFSFLSELAPPSNNAATTITAELPEKDQKIASSSSPASPQP